MQRIVTLLDCSDLDTAIASLSAHLDVDSGDLVRALERLDEQDCPVDVDPDLGRPAAALASLDRDPAARPIPSAYYFHATRVVDPGVFHRDGIRALPSVIDELWATLGHIASDYTPERWRELRARFEANPARGSAQLLQDKLGDRMHWGPHGELIRELFLDCPPPMHDYLAAPEAVEDICQAYGDDLLARFRDATTPCIVKFQAPALMRPERTVAAVCWYIHARLLSVALPLFRLASGYAGQGIDVPPTDVVSVEIATGRQPAGERHPGG
jgi:hypothetical protein